MSKAEQYLNEALAAWDFGGELVGAVRYGHGHINDTFCVHTQPGEEPCRRFILQRLSSAAFKHPEQVMTNIAGVTAYLGKRLEAEGGDPSRETLTVFTTADGKPYYTDSEGSVWRCYPLHRGHGLPAKRRDAGALRGLRARLRPLPARAERLQRRHPL